MTNLLQSLSHYSAEILLVLCVLTLISLIASYVTARKAKKQRARWSELLEGPGGDSLEHILYDHLRERMVIQEHIDRLAHQVNALEEANQTAKRYIGLVRYDAFEEVGGSQSFALAVYDDQGNGAIVTSVVGRTDCRVYCKPLINGRSERSLSQEEQRAISEAKSPAPKTIVSH